MNKRKIQPLMRVAIAVSLALALGIFYPALVPRVWHLRYPNGVHYSGRDILVPPQWIADEKGPTVRLTKYPSSVFAEMPQGRILLTPMQDQIAPAGEDAGQIWEAQFRMQNTAKGKIVQGPVKYGLGEKESVCMESYAENNPAKISATCRMYRGEWAVDFMGHPKDLDFFLERFQAMNQN